MPPHDIEAARAKKKKKKGANKVVQHDQHELVSTDEHEQRADSEDENDSVVPPPKARSPLNTIVLICAAAAAVVLLTVGARSSSAPEAGAKVTQESAKDSRDAAQQQHFTAEADAIAATVAHHELWNSQQDRSHVLAATSPATAAAASPAHGNNAAKASTQAAAAPAAVPAATTSAVKSSATTPTSVSATLPVVRTPSSTTSAAVAAVSPPPPSPPPPSPPPPSPSPPPPCPSPPSPSPPAAPTADPPSAPVPAATWSTSKGYNCWPGHGAQDIDTDGPLASAKTLTECQAVCEQTAGCEGLVVIRSTGACYRKTAIELRRCSKDGANAIADTYVIHLALPPPPPLEPSPPAEPGRGGPMTPVREMFDRWYENTDERFWSMWGGAYLHREPHSQACWDWDGDPEYWQHTFEGAACERNWLAGAVGGFGDRPFFDGSPALLGFDETINEFCSGVLGVDAWDGFDLNLAIANRCRDARRNVLRDLQGSWSMCVNLQWQLCAVNGKLPNQGSRQMSFATAPKDLMVEWWEDPQNNPVMGKWIAFGCCSPDRFSVADVFFAELFVAYSICENGPQIFALEVGELFTCDLGDGTLYKALAEKFRSS